MNINEFKQEDLDPIKSFDVNDDLNRKIWDKDDKLKPELKEKLLYLTDLFLDEIDYEFEIKDIILCGSLCNYNYSKYSDFDIHIVVDYTKIDQEKKDILVKYTDLFKKYFKIKYNIEILKYDVEFYVQNKDDEFNSAGIYSIRDDKWLSKPSHDEHIKIEISKIKSVAIKLMKELDKYESIIKTNSYDMNSVTTGLSEIWYDIKKYRKEGLSSKKGEYSYGNLVFKLLRRNGYIQKYMDMKKKMVEDEFNK